MTGLKWDKWYPLFSYFIEDQVKGMRENFLITQSQIIDFNLFFCVNRRKLNLIKVWEGEGRTQIIQDKDW